MSTLHCLFLSPHLDDVVLSCSLRILQERKAGCSVKVATLFSSARPRFFGADFYCGRRKEDAAALKILGVDDPIWLGFPDAVFRSPRYWGFTKIMIEEHPEDNKFLNKVAARVCALYEDCAPETIFLPLAVGNHIDHRFTFAMWSRLPAGANIVFYEDRPYSFISNSVRLRLQSIGAAGADRQNDLNDLVQALSKESMYNNVLKNKKERMRYAVHLVQSAARIGSLAMNIEAEILSTQSVNDFEQIEKAVAAYTSQVGMLYNHMKTFRDENHLYTQTLDPSAVYAERYWKLIQ